jgi:glycerophosphoryl diester phosphodiesterase
MSTLDYLEKLIDNYFAYLPRSKPVSINASTQLIAHRGAHSSALSIKENTLAAFDRALQLGCDGIELDVHACADGVLVVNHDSTLKRLWEKDIAIHTLPFNELRALVPEVPSLAEVIERYGRRMHLYIELKAPFTAVHELALLLQMLTPAVDYHLLCLDETILPTLTLFPNHALLLVPMHTNVKLFCKLSIEQHYGGVMGHYLLVGNQQIKQLTAAEQLVGVGFVDSKFSLYRELQRGVDHLFTNNAGTVAALLKELKHRQI